LFFFVFVCFVVENAETDERRAAKARKRDGVFLVFLLVAVRRCFVEEHVACLVVGVDARYQGETSDAVV